MVSLELARKLKEAGLKWEPQLGDWFSDGDYKPLPLIELNIETLSLGDGTAMKTFSEIWYWIPRLDQLLAEIERRGYWWSIENGLAEYLWFFVKQDGKKFIKQSFWANSPEEATAQALIWILEQEQATE